MRSSSVAPVTVAQQGEPERLERADRHLQQIDVASQERDQTGPGTVRLEGVLELRFTQWDALAVRPVHRGGGEIP